MRKLYSLIIFMMFGAVAMSAQDQITVRLQVDDPSHYQLTDQMMNVIELTEGVNELTATQYSYYTLNAVDPYYIKSVKINGEEETLYNHANFSIYFSQGNANALFEVESGSLTDARTASFTLTTDDYTKVRLYCTDDYYQPELTSNVTVIPFAPELETNWQIWEADNNNLYKVTYNGTPVTNMYGLYNINDMADGAQVEVITQFPDIPVAVHFELTADQADLIDEVKVNDVTVTNYLDDDFTVNFNSNITICFNIGWKVGEVIVNGQGQWGWGNVRSFNIMEETTFAFDATRQQTNTINIKVDNPNAVEFYLDGFWNGVKKDLVAGDNFFEVVDFTNLEFRATEGNLIAGVSRIDANGTTALDVENPSEYSVIYVSEFGDCTFEISTASLADAQTAQYTINIDCPADVVVRSPFGPIDLVVGENTIKYSPEYEKTIEITPADYTVPIYRVTQNGTSVSPEWGAYNITLAPNDVIDIVVTMPEGNVPVHFVYTSDLARTVVSDVQVNYSSVTDYNDPDFEVAIGSHLSIDFDTSNAKLTKVVVNGVDMTESIYINYSLTVMEETTIEISAEPYQGHNVTIDIDNPDAVAISYFDLSNYSSHTLNLNAGVNTVSIPESVYDLRIEPSGDNYKIVSLAVDGSVESPGWGGGYTVSVSDGITIEITTEAVVRENKAMAFIGAGEYYSIGITGVGYFNALDVSWETVLTPYYKEFEFDNDQNPMRISVNSPEKTYVYVNNQPLESTDESYFNYPEYTFRGGDVIKFFNHEPMECQVSINSPEGIATVTVDQITNPEYFGIIACLEGTQIDIEAAADAQIVSVTVNGIEIQPENGKYTFFINEAFVSVKIEGQTTGIDSIDAATTGTDVYNTNGMLLIRNASSRQINALPRGVYIINGNKVVK